MHVERHRDTLNDPLLRVEPSVEIELETVAPDVKTGGQRLQNQCELQDLPVLAGQDLDLVAFIVRVRRAIGRGLEWQIGDVPLAELDQRGDQELAKSDHEMSFVGLDLLRVDGLEREQKARLRLACQSERR